MLTADYHIYNCWLQVLTRNCEEHKNMAITWQKENFVIWTTKKASKQSRERSVLPR